MGFAGTPQASVSDTPLLDWVPPTPQGETFNEALDGQRLCAQRRRVLSAVLGKGWFTLRQISEMTGDPEASVSASLRDIARAGFHKDRQRVPNGNGLHRYRITANLAQVRETSVA